jgi:hypothetical protein
MNKKLFFPSIIIAVLLIIAIFPINEYGYYIFLRWVVCLSGAFFAYQAYQIGKKYWAWIMGTITVLFNPIIPIYLNKEIWRPIDIISAGIFIVSLIILKENKLKI